MKKLQFTIEIKAPKEKVWDALWQDENYRNWTAIFHEGSHYESDLKKGSKVYFLGPNKEGMYGIVEDVVLFEKMYFLHYGEFKNGVEQEPTYGKDATERYDLSEKNGVTTLTMTMNSPEEYISYFVEIFPKALEKVKEISEN